MEALIGAEPRGESINCNSLFVRGRYPSLSSHHHLSTYFYHNTYLEHCSAPIYILEEHGRYGTVLHSVVYLTLTNVHERQVLVLQVIRYCALLAAPISLTLSISRSSDWYFHWVVAKRFSQAEGRNRWLWKWLREGPSEAVARRSRCVSASIYTGISLEAYGSSDRHTVRTRDR